MGIDQVIQFRKNVSGRRPQSVAATMLLLGKRLQELWRSGRHALEKIDQVPRIGFLVVVEVERRGKHRPLHVLQRVGLYSSKLGDALQGLCRADGSDGRDTLDLGQL